MDTIILNTWLRVNNQKSESKWTAGRVHKTALVNRWNMQPFNPSSYHECTILPSILPKHL